jgi:hypothetical protein
MASMDQLVTFTTAVGLNVLTLTILLGTIYASVTNHDITGPVAQSLLSLSTVVGMLATLIVVWYAFMHSEKKTGAYISAVMGVFSTGFSLAAKYERSEGNKKLGNWLSGTGVVIRLISLIIFLHSAGPEILVTYFVTNK